jgi:hypothetical protein
VSHGGGIMGVNTYPYRHDFGARVNFWKDFFLRWNIEFIRDKEVVLMNFKELMFSCCVGCMIVFIFEMNLRIVFFVKGLNIGCMLHFLDGKNLV